MELTNRFERRIQTYKDAYRQYGYSEKSLEMPSDRRTIRYYDLIKNFDFFKNPDERENFTILDAGCGFGDINNYLQMLGIENYKYIGLDVVDEFLKAAKKMHTDENKLFINRNFITERVDDLTYDYAISSQAFNDPYTSAEDNNYEVLFSAMNKLYSNCRRGISFNFVTDKGDYKKAGIAYHDPAKVMNFAYSLSKNVIMDNSSMPFECTCTIIKDSIIYDGKLFESFYKTHLKDFNSGNFVVKGY